MPELKIGRGDEEKSIKEWSSEVEALIEKYNIMVE